MEEKALYNCHPKTMTSIFAMEQEMGESIHDYILRFQVPQQEVDSVKANPKLPNMAYRNKLVKESKLTKDLVKIEPVTWAEMYPIIDAHQRLETEFEAAARRDRNRRSQMILPKKAKATVAKIRTFFQVVAATRKAWALE